MVVEMDLLFLVCLFAAGYFQTHSQRQQAAKETEPVQKKKGKEDLGSRQGLNCELSG